MAQGLPFGRPPTQVPQTQFLDERRRSIPRQDGGIIQSVPFVSSPTAVAITAGQLRLTPIDMRERDYTLSEARVYVFFAAAGESARTGLYVYNLDERRFTLIPGSEARFSTTATGLIKTKLEKSVTVSREAMLFVGFNVTSVTPTFSCSAAGAAGGRGFYTRTLTTPTTALIPSNINLSDTAAAATTNVPFVAYLSQQWAQVV